MNLVRRTLLIIFLLAPLFQANPAMAHRFAPSLLKITQTGEQNYNIAWKTPALSSGNVPLQPFWPEACQVVASAPVLLEGTGNVSRWTLRCDPNSPGGLVGQTFGVSGLAANKASAIIQINLADGQYHQQVVNSGNPEFVVPAEPGGPRVMMKYSNLGTSHIWSGIDHLLFVFGLLLLVGGGKRLLWTITAFTAGHSITLSLVTLGLFDYPVALVEFVIALSIFVLAVELARSPGEGLFRRNPWWLAGGFGLLHGMGFAGALAEAGLPQSNVTLALLFFNIGIEIGQLAFILLMLAIWWLIRPLIAIQTTRLLPVPVYVLGGLSAMWCIERAMQMVS